MNILAIDYGIKNIGLAINNGTNIAFPFKSIFNIDSVIDSIIDSAIELSIDKIVIGMPTKYDRSEGDLANKIRSFANDLKQRGYKVEFEDELLSSSQVKEMMKEYEGKYEKDAIEASVILQSFLDRK